MGATMARRRMDEKKKKLKAAKTQQVDVAKAAEEAEKIIEAETQNQTRSTKKTKTI